MNSEHCDTESCIKLRSSKIWPHWRGRAARSWRVRRAMTCRRGRHTRRHGSDERRTQSIMPCTVCVAHGAVVLEANAPGRNRSIAPVRNQLTVPTGQQLNRPEKRIGWCVSVQLVGHTPIGYPGKLHIGGHYISCKMECKRKITLEKKAH